MATPEDIKPYISALTADFERRPLADQIIDQLLASDPYRYSAYEAVREKENLNTPDLRQERNLDTEKTQEALGRFIARWIQFEQRVRAKTEASWEGTALKPWLVPTTRIVAKYMNLDQRTIAEIDRIRRFRNNVVHGVELPSAEEINEATKVLEAILEVLEK
jgi:hypothetical protein